MDPIVKVTDNVEKIEYTFVAPHITKFGMIRKSKIRQRRSLFVVYYGGIADFEVVYSESLEELTRMRNELIDGVRLYYNTLTKTAAVTSASDTIPAPKADDIPLQK